MSESRFSELCMWLTGVCRAGPPPGTESAVKLREAIRPIEGNKLRDEANVPKGLPIGSVRCTGSANVPPRLNGK